MTHHVQGLPVAFSSETLEARSQWGDIQGAKRKKKKNMLQTKEQGKILQYQINEDKICNLPEKEFRVMIEKMIQNLGNRMEKIQEIFNNDLEELKSKQTGMNTNTEIKNTLEGINNRIIEAEEQISELKDKMVEITSR